MRDETNEKQVKRCISPVSVSDNTATVGQIIDHQGYDAATYVLAIGSVADADATFAVLLEEGNAANLSDNTTVANTDMVTQTSGVAPLTAASFQYDSDDQVRKLGYVGAKRYTRLTITPTSNASAALFSAVCILEEPARRPVTQATA